MRSEDARGEGVSWEGEGDPGVGDVGPGLTEGRFESPR